MDTFQFWLTPYWALAMTALAISLLRKPAIALGLTDRPGGRKQHQGVVPLTGGLGVFIGFLAVVPLLPLPLGEWLPLLVGMAMLVLCGVVDDARDMRSLVKLGVQLAAALLLVVWGGLAVHFLGTFPGVGAVTLGWVALPLTVVAVAGLVNAVNMMDGIDGLAGGMVVAMLGWLAFVAGLQGQYELLGVILSLAAAVVGFLLFNLRHPWRSKASVFMGDAGSMALGFAIAWFVVALSQAEVAVISPIAYGWILVLPVMDTLSLAIRRVRKGQSPFSADREHLHHIFLRAGFTHGGTTLTLVLVAFGLGAVGVLGSLVGVPDVLLLMGLIGAGLLHYVFIQHAWRTSKALRRLHAASLSHYQPAFPNRAFSLRTRPLVSGWRRLLALAGLYLAVFSVGWAPALAAFGALVTVVATLAVLPTFWRDTARQPLFWAMALLALYISLRSLSAQSVQAVASDWQALLLLTGIVSLPLGWWLAQLRWHWPWLMSALFIGAAAAFVMGADWSRMEDGLLANPWVWGRPSEIGFLASIGLMLLVALLFSGLQRLGSGWRPAWLVGVALALSVIALIILVATHYVTGWLGALAGLACFVMGSFVLGRRLGHRLGYRGILALGVLMLVSFIAWYWLSTGERTVLEGITQPLRAALYFLRGQADAAYAMHPGMVERLTLWLQARDAWLASPLLGTGSMAPLNNSGWVEGYHGYHSLYASITVGFGLVGLVGFCVLTFLCIRAVMLMGLLHAWPSAWSLGLLCCCVNIVVMFALAVPIRDPASLALVVLVMAACCAAAFQHHWLLQRKSDTRGGQRSLRVK